MCAVALSLRLKGVLSVGAVLLVVLACRVYSRQARLAGLLAVTAILGLAVGFYEGEIVSRQVTTYTAGASAKNPRGLLYQVGTDIARDNFPLGAGFGRFGSFTSGVHYSPIYTVNTALLKSMGYPATTLIHIRYVMGIAAR